MTSAAVAELETETVVHLPVQQLYKSPSQPRRRGEDKPLDPDFVASIREKGVRQPIVVRVREAGGWEIVFGHRRWIGSSDAGRATIPAIVRDLTDEEVFEDQLIENIHRQDMHPLDEAYGFERMIKHGRTATEIAAKIGRPLNYVVQRLKLCELTKTCRAAIDADKISLGVALAIAKVPSQLQDEALKELTRYREPSVADAQRMLHEHYLLRLDQAPFDVDDAALVQAAGACTTCPKRTGQQRELFPDVARADMCIDRVCYRGKVDAVWQIRKKAAKTAGQEVLEGKAAAQAIRYGGGYKDVERTEYIGGREKKVRSLFGKDLPPVTLARDPETGTIMELVREKDVQKAARKNRPATTNAVNKAEETRRKGQAEKERRKTEAVELAIAAAVERTSRLTDSALVRLLVQTLISLSYEENEATLNRRNADVPKDKRQRVTDPEKGMQSLLAGLKKPEEIAGVGLELALRTASPSRWRHSEKIWEETLKALGLDFDAIQKQAVADAKVKAKAEAQEKKKAKKPAAAKKARKKA